MNEMWSASEEQMKTRQTYVKWGETQEYGPKAMIDQWY